MIGDGNRWTDIVWVVTVLVNDEGWHGRAKDMGAETYLFLDKTNAKGFAQAYEELCQRYPILYDNYLVSIEVDEVKVNDEKKAREALAWLKQTGKDNEGYYDSE